MFWGVLVAILVCLGLASWAMVPNVGALASYQLTAKSPTSSAVVPVPAAFNPKLGSLARFQYDLTPALAGPSRSALYVPAHGGDVQISLNGLVLTRGESHPAVRINRYLSASSARFALSRSQNALIITQFNNPTGESLGPVFAGPAEIVGKAASRYARSDATVQALALFSIITAIFMSMVLIFFAQQPSRYFCLFVMFVLILIIRYESQWTVFGEPIIRLINYVGSLCQLMGFMAVSLWTQGPARERRYAAILCALVMIILAVADMSFGLDSEKTVILRIALFALPGMATAIFVIVRVRFMTSMPTQETQLLFAIIAALALSFLINIMSLYGPVPVEMKYWSTIGSRLLTSFCLVALSAFALYFEVARYRLALRNSAAMGEIVAGHTMQLDTQSQQLKSEIERRAVLEERQRFTRDMHDGIGGQLLSLLLKARSGTVAMEEVERDVAQSLHDLRLVAASLDGADEGLAVSLASFRARAADQLEAAGVALDWQETGDSAAVSLDARQTLDLLRILQEAVTNIIRHAKASRVTIQIAFDHQTKTLSLSIADDGKGFETTSAAASGQGLANMKVRAARLGGDINFLRPHGHPGTVISFVMQKPARTVSQTN